MKMVFTILICLQLGFISSAQENAGKSISKNGMKVEWTYAKNTIRFSISAPTQGWVAIGFNENTFISGAYLIMARVVNGKAEVQEHYTKSPGNYSSFIKLGLKTNPIDVSGKQEKTRTLISFSLPLPSNHKHQKPLNEGMEYNMIIAYSQADDFQHHSRMRSSVQVKL